MQAGKGESFCAKQPDISITGFSGGFVNSGVAYKYIKRHVIVILVWPTLIPNCHFSQSLRLLVPTFHALSPMLHAPCSFTQSPQSNAQRIIFKMSYA